MTSKEPAGRLNRANMTTGPSPAVFKALILPEIIMLLARHIPLQRDLLSFGLVHSSFHHVVIPYYLRFREVVLGITDTKMWSYLLEDSRRLATVEVMRIGIESWYTIPPRPASVTQTVSDPFQLIESALRGMRNLREVYWEHLASGWGLLREDQHLWQGAFWDMLPRICDRIQVVSLSLHEPSWGHPDGCPSCAFLSELHHLKNIQIFKARFFRCYHDSQDGARTIQKTLFAAFSTLEELHLQNSQLMAIPEFSLPSLKALSLLNVQFEASDGLLRLLKASPGLRSFRLESGSSGRFVPKLEEMGVTSGTSVVPLLESFVGCWEDARLLGFHPLPEGTFRKLSRLRIIESDRQDWEESSVAIGSRALIESDPLIGRSLQDLTINMTVKTQRLTMRRTADQQDLLWATWFSQIAQACPRLRRLAIIVQDRRAAPQGFRDETDGWKLALSRLRELTVLRLPHAIWQADVDDAGPKGAASRLVAEQCVEWLPKIRLLSTPRKLALVVSDADQANIVLKKSKLLDQGGVKARKWSLYEDVSEKELDGIIADLVQLAVKAETEVWPEDDHEGWW